MANTIGRVKRILRHRFKKNRTHGSATLKNQSLASYEDRLLRYKGMLEKLKLEKANHAGEIDARICKWDSLTGKTEHRLHIARRKGASEETTKAVNQLLTQAGKSRADLIDEGEKLLKEINEIDTQIASVKPLISRLNHALYLEEMNNRAKARKSLSAGSTEVMPEHEMKEIGREIKKFGYTVEALMELEAGR